ncbi:unnamed protein product [Strongylus vulgaris]|uniref:Hint domain-containing protein n=1 Tax=Strongylus vulgaris TaxID=40348 RepID=A0A3P7IN58_STRVU|nr:unnamed protein product [Strongylus vulgaris]
MLELKMKCKPFKDVVCIGELQWTGGLEEVNNGTHNVLNAACCSYSAMAHSQLVRTIFLGQDDSYEGGFHEKPGQVGGFDLIKEVRKSVIGDNKYGSNTLIIFLQKSYLKNVFKNSFAFAKTKLKKKISSFFRVQYIITIHRLPCSTDRTRFRGYTRSPSRNKRRMDENKKENEYEYEWEENEGRRPAMRDYDDYYDYDYAVIVPRQMMSRRQHSNSRLWPLARAHADGGIFQTNDVIPLKGEQDVIVNSGSAISDEFSSLSSSQQQVPVAQAMPVTSVDGPLPPPLPSSYQQLPQYVPAYKEVAYTPAPYIQPPAQQVQFRQPHITEAPPQRVQYREPFSEQPQYRQPLPTPPSEYARAAQVPVQPAPAQQYYYYPYYQGGLNGLFEAMQCFSGDMEVETPSGPKAIKNLEVGDMVLSIDESMVTFSPVIMFLHKLENEHAQFLQINLETGESLKLTENHLMYVTNCAPEENLRLISARDSRIGQCVQITDSAKNFAARRIVSIDRVAGVGIYAPLTSTGDIMVNHVLVSCHSNLALKTLQQTFFSIYRSLSALLPDYIPNNLHDDAHLPFGVHYLTSVVDLFLPKMRANTNRRRVVVNPFMKNVSSVSVLRVKYQAVATLPTCSCERNCF